jgi:hypothetical protein
MEENLPKEDRMIPRKKTRNRGFSASKWGQSKKIQ